MSEAFLIRRILEDEKLEEDEFIDVVSTDDQIKDQIKGKEFFFI